MKISRILCRLGFHKWSEPKFYTSARSNVLDYSQYCVRCKKPRRWSEPKRH